MATARAKKGSIKRQQLFRFGVLVIVLVIVNIVGSFFNTRIDLTGDKRFTLSDKTVQLMKSIEDDVFVQVYLTGDLPSGFKRLEIATRDLLNDLRSISGGKIHYQFIDPLSEKSIEERKAIYADMMKKGIQPTNIQTAGGDAYSEKIIIPGATVFYKGRESTVNLLLNEQGVAAQRALNNSVSRLEAKLSTAIERVTKENRSRIAFVRGHGELPLYRIYDFVSSVSDFYQTDTLVLESMVSIPKEISLLIIAKPTSPFSEKDKFKIDQYVMNGGSVLWLLDALRADMDSLQVKPSFLATDYNLNLEDLLFTYGARLNPVLLMDLQCVPVPLLTNYINNQPEFRLFPCYYFPVFTPSAKHVITKDVDAVVSLFAATIDKPEISNITQTTLLASSAYSRQAFTPWLVDFKVLKQEPVRSEFNKKGLSTAVLLEGSFRSVFQNRISPALSAILRDSLNTPLRETGAPAKQIVIADGDMIANDFSSNGQPFTLGYYKYTKDLFANKKFLQNCVDYLTGNEHRIDMRAKDIKLRLLDAEKVKAERTKWQLINVALPIVVVVLFGVMYAYIRLRRYAV